MRSRLIIAFCGVGVIVASIVTLVTNPNVFSLLEVSARDILAAVGNVSIPTLRTWQRQGGFTNAMGRGAEGPDVSLVQQVLATDASAYPSGIVSGYYGALTENAVRQFQGELGIPKTGVFDQKTGSALNIILYNELCPSPAVMQPDESGAHITRDTGIQIGYVPPNLSELPENDSTGIVCATRETTAALGQLIAAAASENILLEACSGYRGPGVQGYLLTNYESVGTGSGGDTALPGHSEHQTGTAIDFTSDSVQNACASDSFEKSAGYSWLVANAWRYGFNLSYPEGNPDYTPEAWHWRYVGTTTAAALYVAGVSYNGYTEPFRGTVIDGATVYY